MKFFHYCSNYVILSAAKNLFLCWDSSPFGLRMTVFYGFFRNIFRIFLFTLLLAINMVGGSFAKQAEDVYKVEIKDSWFYVNGEKFFIKGINYCGFRPGESPQDLDPVDLKLVERDFQRIKEAGFNTIRTSGGLNSEIVALARKYGLMVMHGLWFDADIDYSEPQQIKYAAKMLKEDLAWSKKHDNIICFLVMNEPLAERVRDAGQLKMESFLKSLKDTVKGVIPDRPASFASWVPLAFIDYSFWDAACFNVYLYGPVTITHSLGYLGYLKWLKNKFAQDKPLIITEFGLSVSSRRIAEATLDGFGYGGNSLQMQKDGNLKMYDDIIQSGSSGACVFSWLDEWWMIDEKTKHDDHPEEYFGITSMDSNPQGALRPAYYALKTYNQGLIIEPKKDFYQQTLPIEIYATENPRVMKYRIDGSRAKDLEKEGNFWWKAKADISGLKPGRHVLEIKVLDKKLEVLSNKKQYFWIGEPFGDGALPYQVKIITNKEEYKIKEKLELVVKVQDVLGRPVANQMVNYAFFQPIGWEEYSNQKPTDKNGEVTIKFSTFTAGYLTISAGVNFTEEDCARTFGDIKVVRIRDKDSPSF